MIRTHYTDPHCRGVFDVPSSRFLSDIMWIDTLAAQYGVIARPARTVGSHIVTRLVQVKKIEYVASALVFLVDPIDDQEPDELLALIGKPQPAVTA